MTGTDDGLRPGTASGDAYTFAMCRRIIKQHMPPTGDRPEQVRRRCPQCPPVLLDLGSGEVPKCPVAQWAADYVRRHHANREGLRAAVQVADELRDLLRIKPAHSSAFAALAGAPSTVGEHDPDHDAMTS